MKDELAERRAAKGTVTIKIAAGEAAVLRHVETRLQGGAATERSAKRKLR